jgi:predicted homoserine dehydrogenase-like protein
MIIIDTALAKLEAEGRPIRVGMMGAGFMGKGLALQMCGVVRGIRLVAIASRRTDEGLRVYREAGIPDAKTADTVSDLSGRIRGGKYSVTEDARLLCQSDAVDVVFDATGSIDFSAEMALETFKNGKHFIHMNAELDGTLGPILKTYADKAGVIYSFTDGDQPGVEMNLYRFVKSIGLRPILCGNIKGLQDPYRNPTTQEGYAKKWNQKPHMVASFADGTKISFEQAIVANGTGMTLLQRGMLGPTVPETGMPLKDALSTFPLDEIAKGPGVVDYIVGAEPAPGVFVVGDHDHPAQRKYLELYKMGNGPHYLFYTPYHLCHFEAPLSIARAFCFNDAVLTPAGGPKVDVVTTAKTDLKSGQRIDLMGGYTVYGQCETAEIAFRDRLLPMGLSKDCRLKRDITKDEVISYEDVEIPAERISDRLRDEQNELFFNRIL